MTSLLPSPPKIENIVCMFSLSRYFAAKNNLVGQSFSIDEHLKYMSKGKMIKPSHSAYGKINIYMLNRSMHQVNEACNKLWSTAELFHSMQSKKRLCKKFDANFLPSSTIPTLHYSNISALLSLLSLFGVSSIAYRSKNKIHFYNLVRTTENLVFMERTRWLGNLFGSAKNGWHRQVLQTYEGLSKKGIALPKLDLKKCERLLEERNRFDYDILGQTSMKGAYGTHHYFELLPTTISSIEAAIRNLHQVIKPLPNRCDERFADLSKKLDNLTIGQQDNTNSCDHDISEMYAPQKPNFYQEISNELKFTKTKNLTCNNFVVKLPVLMWEASMDRRVEVNIEKAYELIKKDIPQGTEIDSLDIVKQVENYRQLWKPDEINVILLAESHVFTNGQDHKIGCASSILHEIIPNYPLCFVRFVYCLGYGEDELLTAKIKGRKNTGTPQYWKIFSSCVAENQNDLGFHAILKTKTPSLIQRLRNKVKVLQKMRGQGVWLLDASIVGLYGSGKKDQKFIERTMEVCWWNHVANAISESNLKHIIIIGKGVGDILYPKLQKLHIPFTTIPQPQVRGTSQWQLENYKKYQQICAKNC